LPLSQGSILQSIFLIVILFTVTGYVCAGGQGEDPFAEVDLLFSEKRYSEGIQKLNEILQENPELFEEVQVRNEVYLEVQKAISELEEGIIEDIKNENPEGIFEKIGAIRDLDPQPNEYRAAVLTDYLYEAAIIVNKAQVDEIMDRALAAIREGEYWQAIEIYSSGLDVGREIFETSDYGELAINSVISLRTELEAALLDFEATGDVLDNAAAAFDLAMETGSIAAIAGSVDLIYQDLKDLAEYRNTIKSYESTLEDARASMRLQREDNRDIAYLRYLSYYLTGRETVEDEGVLPILDSLWSETYASVENKMNTYFVQLYDSARSTFERGDWDASIGGFRQVVQAAPVAAKTASLGTVYVTPGPDYTVEDADRDRLQNVYDKIVYIRGRQRISSEHIQSIPVLQEANTLNRISDFASVGQLQSRRIQIAGAVEDLDSALASLRDEAGYFIDQETKGIATQDEQALFTELETRISNSITESRDFDISLAVRIADSRISPLVDDFDPLEERVKEGRRLVEGVLTTATGLELPDDVTEDVRAQAILKKYPDRGRIVLLEARSALIGLRRDTDTVLAGLESDKEYVLSDTRMIGSLETGRSLANDIDELEGEVFDLIASAEEGIRLANNYRDEAYDYIAGAEESIQVEDFTGAKSFLTLASNAALESIAYRQDDLFAADIDNSVATLTDDINAALVRIIVQEVDGLVSQAQQLYGRQEYDAAEGALLQAQSRWASIYSEPDFYIEYYLSLVQTALSVQTGRDIPETDSLYREMRQYLNYALADYKEAEVLLAARDRVGAQRKLDEVSENLRVVLQQYPYNEEANILNWRIKRIEDIDEYNRDIRDAVNEARVAINTPAAADAYSELQTIKRLEPGYPGLDDLIYQAEINLGLRTPPQTVEKTNLATDLYAEALDLYNTGNSGNYQDALDRLNQALVINPNYADARELRNTINAEKGGTVTTTLSSSEDMQFYLQAVKLVGDNRPEQALPIIRRLWNNEANRNYKGLIDLKSSVERTLGVR